MERKLFSGIEILYRLIVEMRHDNCLTIFDYCFVRKEKEKEESSHASKRHASKRYACSLLWDVFDAFCKFSDCYGHFQSTVKRLLCFIK